MSATEKRSYPSAHSAAVYGFILLSRFLLAQEVSIANCSEPWFTAVDKHLTVSWRGVERYGTVRVTAATKDVSGRQCEALQLKHANFNDWEVRPDNPCSNALYEVTCELTCGDVIKLSNMTERTAPDAPEISYVKATNTTIMVNWTEPYGPIKSYRVKWVDFTENFTDTKKPHAKFEELQPYTMYNISVSAFNEVHQGNWSEHISITTDQGVPHAPRNLTVSVFDSEGLWLKWDEPIPSTGPILWYELKWTESEDESFSLGRTNITFFEVQPLRPYTEYIIWVAAVTEVGKGPSSNITQKTDLAVPEPPKVNCSATNTSIVVSWEGFYRGPYPTFSLRWKKKLLYDFKVVDFNNSLKENRYDINELDPFTTYQIQVRARNDAGTGRWSDIFEINTLIGIPTAPKKLRVDSKSATSIVMRWNVPDPPNGPSSELKYEVSKLKQLFIFPELMNETRFEDTDLAPFTHYEYAVSAISDVGRSDWSDTLKVQTDVSTPSEPLDLHEVVLSTSILLKWRVPKHMNGPHVSYVIKWSKMTKELNENEDRNSNDTTPLFIEVEVNGTTYNIDGLDPYSRYNVEVCAASSAGIGKCTIPRIIRTAAGIPQAVSVLEVKHVQPTNMTLHWRPPTQTNGLLQKYIVRWGVTGTDGSDVQTKDKYYDALGLRPYTEYFFRVAAETEAGTGPFSTVYIRTLISNPSAPTGLVFSDLTDHTALLKWTTPEHPNSPFVEYMINLYKTPDHVLDQVHTTNDTDFRLTGLDSATNYSAEVGAFNRRDTVVFAEILYFQTKEKDHSSAVIVGSVVGVLLVLFIIVVVLLVILAKRKGGLKNIMPTKSPVASTETLQTINSIELDVLPEKLTVQNFDEHVVKLGSNGFYNLTQEFEKLRRESPAFSSHEAKKNENLTKNRWVKILPYDHSRVKLLPLGDEVEPDFINASYVPGDSYLLDYIAAQGPLSNTVNDFWRMVWEKSVFLIVMLTQCVERAKRTCERYWPSPGDSCKYGTVDVHMISESITSSYIIRLMLISQGGQKRHIVQLHYINWPVSGCPKSPDDFLNFIKTVRGQVSCGVTGPMLVHCSAGIGRTGTFIAVDQFSQQIARQNADLDVYGTVLEMRRYRPCMVQTEEQYYFIHLCVQRLIQEKRQELEGDYGEGIYTN